MTNLRGELVTLGEIYRQTLTQLDGSRDLDRLTDALLDPLRRNEMILRRDGDASIVSDEAEMRTLLEPALRKVLEN